MRSTAEINQDIFTVANRRLAIYSAGVHHPDDLFAIRALEKRLFDLYEEKRTAMAGDQVKLKRSIPRVDPLLVQQEKMPWETQRLDKPPLVGVERRAAAGRTRDALIRLERERDAAAA
jgi:hypothetical protein